MIVMHPRISPRRLAPARVFRPKDVAEPKPRASLELELAGQDSQRHAGLTTPPPPRPPAPGTQAAAWRDAIFEKRDVRRESHEREVAMRRARSAVRIRDPGDRDLARAMADATKGLRVKAQELEAVAADGSVVKEVRDAHARAAGSLRNQAEKLDINARRKLFGG